SGGARRAAERAGSVAVVGEDDAGGEESRQCEGRGRHTLRDEVEGVGLIGRKRGFVRAGDGRWLVNREGEGLGDQAGGVAGGELEGVNAARARGRRAAQNRRAVRLVHEGQAGGQTPILGDLGGGRQTGVGRDRERARLAGREN